MKDTLEMREVYTRALEQLMKEDERVVVVEADLSRGVNTLRLRDEFPGRHIDAGIAEQDMVTISAGLAISVNKIPFTHTFAPFISRRAMDQVYLSVGFSNANVKLVGSDPGVSAEINGGTHDGFEDVTLMRMVPNMTIFEPVDAEQLRQAMPQIYKHVGPFYMRMFRKQTEKVFDENYRFVLGKADTLKEGKDVAIIASGIMVAEALKAATALHEQGMEARVINLHTIKPMDTEAVLKAAKECGAIVTAENHNINGGLGGAVCEYLSGACPVPVKRIGVRDHFGEVGKLDFLMEKYAMKASDIVKTCQEAIAMKK
ncbi:MULTISPECIES: transketolase C-terminal domain-containing protein [unclassified Clostridium]|uniref:transketolase family protein n=1 Tax=unclassified Clostridium TaxID=2614128 RepID=UPI0011071B7A|nr:MULTISPECIES: transketolase C-terminal domain-containing protein [unclassified Clostridium]